MQINIDTNQQCFTAFKLCSGAEQSLKNALKPKDWNAFSNIIDSQADNHTVNICLFGRDNNKFYANISPNNEYMENKSMYQWPFFESAIKFFNRITKKADKMTKEIEEMPKVDINSIIAKIEKG